MKFNVYKIEFIDEEDNIIDKIVHSNSEENAIKELKYDWKVLKILKVLYLPTYGEMKKSMVSNWL